MAASIIDTLRYARRLGEAGVAQAEAMANALTDEIVPHPVTKADLVSSVSELKASIAALEARLTWRLPGGVAVIVGLAVALIKLA